MNRKSKLIDISFIAFILVVSFIIRYYFYVPYPTKGDSAEYIYCAINKILPHGPYVLYIWICHFLAKYFDPIFIITLLSFAVNIFSIILFFLIVKRHTLKAVTWISTALFSIIPISIQIAGYAEVYPTMLFFILLAIYLVHYSNKYILFCAGLCFGFAFSTHQSSLFVLPAILLFISKKYNTKLKLYILFGFIFGAGISIVWIIYKMIHLDISKYTNKSFIASFIDYYSTGGSGYKWTLEHFNNQFFYYLKVHAHFLSLPIVILAISGIILSCRSHREIWLFGIFYSFPFILFEFPRVLYIDGGLYYVFLAPSYAVFAAIFLTQTYSALKTKIILIRKYKVNLQQFIFAILMFIWIIFSPTYLYKLKNQELNNVNTALIMRNDFYGDIVAQKNAVFVPPRNSFEALHGGKRGGGCYLELTSNSISINRSIDENGKKIFNIYNPDIKGWKFPSCRVPLTNKWVLNEMSNNKNFITFEEDLLENSNLDEDKYFLKKTNFLGSRELGVIFNRYFVLPR